MDMLRQRYRRAYRMVGVLPIGTLPGEDTLKSAIFWSMPRDSHAGWLDRGLSAWKDEAEPLWPDFAQFAAQITDTTQITMARYTHRTLRKAYGGGVVHIGDCAPCQPTVWARGKHDVAGRLGLGKSCVIRRG